MKGRFLIGETEQPQYHRRSEDLFGAHAFCPGATRAGTSFAKILQHKPAYDRFAVNDAGDGFQLFGLGMTGDFGHQRHLPVPFFAHFVLALFLALVVLTVGWRLLSYYAQPRKTSTTPKV